MVRVLRRLFSAAAAALLLLPAAALCSDGVGTPQGAPRHAPVAFTANRGQWPVNVLFRTSSGSATVWITRDGIVYQFKRRVGQEDTKSLVHWRADLSGAMLRGNSPAEGMCDRELDSTEQLVVRATFAGGNVAPEAFGLEELEYKCNYFLGKDPAGWRTDVPNYGAVLVKDVYPGIDVRYSGDNSGQAVYEFIAAAGADVAQVRANYEGVEETSIDSEGRLIARTKWGQEIEVMGGSASGTRVLSARSSVSGESHSGTEAAKWMGEPMQAMAVGLSYSTYLGGEFDDLGWGIAVDGSGSVYVTGEAGSPNFPTQNPFQAERNLFSKDIFVTKLSSAGNSLVYSTYLGGEDNEVGFSIDVDGLGNAYLTGYTASADFPTQNPYQTYQGSADAFVTKLSGTGNSLIYSTYLGGGADDNPWGIAVDGLGSAYVTGGTASTNFPTQNPYQGTLKGPGDVFVTKFSAGGNSLVYSTFLGGGGQRLGSRHRRRWSWQCLCDGDGCFYRFPDPETLSDGST